MILLVILGLASFPYSLATKESLDDRDYLSDPPHDTRVISLMLKDFDLIISEGDWFVEFYAPWCDHCKHLAKIWHEVAEMHKDNRINMAKVDATVEKTLASRYDVDGFPTLLFFRNGIPREYNGDRSKEALDEFLVRVQDNLLKPITIKSHKLLRRNAPVAFLLVCRDCSKLVRGTIQQLAYDFADYDITFLLATDPKTAAIYDSGNYASRLVRWRKGDTPLAFPGHVPESKEDATYKLITEWVNAKRFPLVTPIKTPWTYSQLAKTGRYVVVGLYEYDRSSKIKKSLRQSLSRLARNAKLSEYFIFSLLDGEEWNTFVNSRFGEKPFPRVVALSGDHVHFENEVDLQSLVGQNLDVAINKFLVDVMTGKAHTADVGWMGPGYGFLHQFRRHGISNAFEHHWFFLLISIFGFILFNMVFISVVRDMCASDTIVDENINKTEIPNKNNNKKKGQKIIKDKKND